MLGDGWYRGRLGLRRRAAQHLRRPAGAARPARGRLRRRHAPRCVTDETWRAAPGPILASDIYDGETYDARLERPAGRRRATTTRDWAGVRRHRPRPRHAGRAVRAAGAPHRAGRAGRDQHLAVGPHDRRLRPEPGRLAAPHRRRPGGHDDHAAPRRGARGRRAVHRAAAHAAATDRYTLRGGGGSRPGSRASPSTASATPRSTAGPASSPRRPRGGRLPLRHGAHRLVRVLRPADQPAARERRLGHARQLPRRPDRLPAARRAPGLDRRHPGLRADRLLPLRQRRLPALVAGRPGRRAGRRRRVPFVVPNVLGDRPAGRRLGRRGHRSCRGCSTSATATWASWQQYDSMRAGSTRAAWRAAAGCGTEAQFGDWLDPTRRPRTRGRPHRPDVVANAWFARSTRP